MQQVSNFDECEWKKSLDLATPTTQDENTTSNAIYNLEFSTDKQISGCNHFIHEPEELSALYDSRRDFPIISPIFNNKMASNTTQLMGDQDFKFTLNDEENPLRLNEEDDFNKGKQSSQSLDELESDLRKNKHCTDADVLNALSVFSERASPVNPSERDFTPHDGLLEKVCNIIQHEMFFDNNSLHSLEYWSDEEGQYPAQMSLSPLPTESTYRITPGKNTTTVNTEKELLKALRTNNEVENPQKSSETTLHMKRSSKRTLSPILSKDSNYLKHQTSPKIIDISSQDITPSFLIDSTENVAKSMIASQSYNWKPRPPPNDWIISPLVRPTIATSPKTRKYKQSTASTEIIPLQYSNRMKGDTFLEMQRHPMPKRTVSRSQSTKTTSTKLFPVISKSQATSKSISDFRQSSSIFGKLVRRNIANERANEKKKDNDKQSKATYSTSSSRNKGGETTRKKLRRVLSLH